ncbi:MAG: PAS domain S-box protein [Spirochaetia bacterium]|nr:PAS domain S-box protein [Spirochaetia bacterium]
MTNSNKKENESDKIPGFFESSRDCIFLYDKNGIIKDINPNGYQQLGYAKNEIVGKNIAQIVQPEVSHEYSAVISKVVEEKKAVFESILENKDGGKMPVEIHAYLLTLDDNDVIFAMHRDISLRKQIENVLGNCDQKYNALFQSCPDGILQMAPDGKILDANVAYIKTSQYTREELKAMNFADLVADENKAQSATQIQAAIAQGNAEFDGSLKIKTGKTWPAHITASYHNSGNGFLFTFMNNQTEHEKLKAQLQESKQTIQKFIDEASMGIVLGKPDGTINYVNKKFANWLGYSVSELVKLNLKDFTYSNETSQKDRISIYENKVKEISKKGHGICKNGEQIYLNATASLYQTSFGEKYILVQSEKINENQSVATAN